MPRDALTPLIRAATIAALETRTDRDLLAKFTADRDEDAFAALVRRHGPLVLGVCRRDLGNEADAEDAFQAVFLVLARKADAVRWQESARGWLYKVAVRIAKDARNRRKIRTKREREVAVNREAATPVAASDFAVVLDATIGSHVSVRAPLRIAAFMPLTFLDDGTEAVSIQAPTIVSAAYTITLPAAVGASGQALRATNGSGTLG